MSSGQDNGPRRSLVSRLARFPWRSLPWYAAPYLALQRVIVLEWTRLLVADSEQVAAKAGDDANDYRLGRLDEARLLEHIRRGDAPGCEAFAARLSEPGLHCFGAEDASGRLVSFAWLHEGSAEAGMNVGDHPVTATPMRLGPDAAFIFHARTAPECRQTGLMTALLAESAATLRAERGVRSLVATTDAINVAARAAFASAGFQDQGGYGVAGWGCCNAVTRWRPRLRSPVVAFEDA